MTDFSAVILTDAADFLIQSEENIERQEKGIEIREPYAINEEEVAQPIQAEKVFIPYATLHNIQYGEFDYETA